MRLQKPRQSHVFLYQYGSNMSPDRLNDSKRLNGEATVISAARLDGWGIRFDLYSKTDDSAVTDIVTAPDECVMGVVYEIPESALDIMDKIEGVRADGTGNYHRANVEVTAVLNADKVSAVTYVGTEAGRERFGEQSAYRQAVKTAYFEHLLAGARYFNFPAEYAAYLRQQAGFARGSERSVRPQTNSR